MDEVHLKATTFVLSDHCKKGAQGMPHECMDSDREISFDLLRSLLALSPCLPLQRLFQRFYCVCPCHQVPGLPDDIKVFCNLIFGLLWWELTKDCPSVHHIEEMGLLPVWRK